MKYHAPRSNAGKPRTREYHPLIKEGLVVDAATAGTVARKQAADSSPLFCQRRLSTCLEEREFTMYHFIHHWRTYQFQSMDRYSSEAS